MSAKVWLKLAAVSWSFMSLTACQTTPPFVDHPRLTPRVQLIDTEFHRTTLGREVNLRLIVPKTIASGLPLSVVYLLHGAGVNFRDWANNSDIAGLAEHNIVLVMPDDESSYYINESARGTPQFEDFFLHEVMPEVHRMQPQSATDREHTAIAGISRGGFGAVVLGLRHPELFSFVGDISGALDLPERRFRYQSPLQSVGMRRAFGPDGSDVRRNYDPFLLVRAVSRSNAPFVFISCGDTDSLLRVNKRFDSLLAEHSLPRELHVVPRGHNWGTWDEQMPVFEASLLSHLGRSAMVATQ